MPIANINGTAIFYQEAGAENAEAMLMIHAGICDSRMWGAQIVHFSKRYHVLALDLRGFGKSRMVQGAFAHYQDVLGLLDVLKIEKAWLMGCSQGGKIAINVALAAPERVLGLLLVAPAIGGYQYSDESYVHPLEEALEAAEKAGNLEQLSELEVQIWHDAGRKPEAMDGAKRQLVWEMNLIPLKVDEALWAQEQQLEPPAIERLETIQKPTLLIYGDLDIPPSIERVEILAQRIAGAKKVLMPNTAHLPNLEQPELFNRIVDEFLA